MHIRSGVILHRCLNMKFQIVIILIVSTIFSSCVNLPLHTDSEIKHSKYRPDISDRRVPAPLRILRRADKVVIALKDIPKNEEIQEMIDDNGSVELPLIGSVKIEGLTTAEAETVIRQAYIDKNFYKKITVIVVAQEEEFFIHGEVMRPGKYPITRDLTLTQAIATASGFTEFAKKTNVQINRGGATLFYNVSRIQQGKEVDPIIKPGDVIIVHRSWGLW